MSQTKAQLIEGLNINTSAPADALAIDSSGNVGIATTSPRSTLHVAGNLTITKASNNPAIVFDEHSGSTDPKAQIQMDQTNSTNASLLFFTEGSGTLSERLRIDSSGNVGIGEISPDRLIHAKNTVDAIITKLETTNSTGRVQVNYVSPNGDWVHGIEGGNTSGDFLTYTAGSKNIKWFTGGSERMRIDSSGRLLVGTSTNLGLGEVQIPDTCIYRQGNASSTGQNVGVLKFGDTRPGEYAQIRAEADNTPGANDFPGRLLFSTTADGASSPTERLRIDSSGRVGIGTSSLSHKLVVDQNNSGGIAAIHLPQDESTIQGSNANTQIRMGGNITISGGGAMLFNTAGSESARIDSSGRVGIGESSPNTKLVVKDASNGLTDSVGNINVISSDSAAIDKGGSIGLGGFYNGTSNSIPFANIHGKKENSTGNNAAGYFAVSTRNASAGTVERMRITSAGKVGIGVAIPVQKLQLHENSSGASVASFTNNTTGDGISDGLLVGLDSTEDGLVFMKESKSIIFGTSNTERMRLTSNGHLGIGTTSPPRALTNADDVTLTTGNAPQYRLNGGAGDSNDNDRAIFGLATASGHFFSGSAANDAVLRSPNGGDLLFGEGTTERARLDSTGNFLVGKTELSDVSEGLSMRVGGVVAFEATVASGAGHCMMMNRQGDDGTYVKFRQANTLEGTITVSGSTVSYNGGHLARWSQLADGAERTAILRGCVLSNLDEMCEWGEEDNEQLNRMKISDVEGDVNVSGVFQAWDDNDDTYTNDFYCAMTGDFVIRIAQGTTVARGDLLMSAGDGTAKPQDDDIVRSKTIAKVTSTTVSTTYADGSYCVPCVLMAC